MQAFRGKVSIIAGDIVPAAVGCGLQDLVSEQFRVIRMVGQEFLHGPVGDGVVVPPEGGGDPLLGEEDVTGALDLLEDVQGGADVVEGFGLAERMVEEAESRLHPGLVAAVFRQQERLEDAVADGLVRRNGGPDEVELAEAVGVADPGALRAGSRMASSSASVE